MLLVDDLTLACEPHWSWQALSFSLGPGECLRIKGFNGCGKSSWLRLLTGLLPVVGKREWRSRSLLPVDVHYVSSESLRCQSSVSHEVRDQFLRSWSSPCDKQWLKQHLTRLKLDHMADQSVQVLSHGQRQQLKLGKCLIREKPIWLLDEPFAFLDQASVEDWFSLIRAHRKNGGLIIYVSHQHTLPDESSVDLRR